MNSLNNISKNTVKAIFALIMIISCVVGFFMGLVTSEFFTGVVTLMVTHYFEGQNTERVQKQLDTAQVEIQQLREHEIQILSEKEIQRI
jgi:hypothetical protein